MDYVITYEQSKKNYLKYKDELEYNILVDDRGSLIYGDQRIERLTKKVYDDLYENHLISKEFHTIETEKLQLKSENNYMLIISFIFIFTFTFTLIYYYINNNINFDNIKIDI